MPQDAGHGGGRLIGMARQTSFWRIRADGVDQAKFRVPRCAMETHSFDKLIRPALHVQGAWCEGVGYHDAVADADQNRHQQQHGSGRSPNGSPVQETWGIALGHQPDPRQHLQGVQEPDDPKVRVRLIAPNLIESITFFLFKIAKN